MRSIVVVVFLSVCCTAYVDYQDLEDESKDDADFDDHYDIENSEDIITTTIITTLDETGGIRNRIRTFGEQSSGAKTLNLDEIQDAKGALKVLLAGHQFDRLTTTGTETITITNENSFETTTRDFTSLTKEVDSVDRTKFDEDLIEEIINNVKKQDQMDTISERKTESTIFETKTDMTTEKINDDSTSLPTSSEEKTVTTSTFPTNISETFEGTPIHETATFTFETVANEEIEFETLNEEPFSKTVSNETSTEKGEKYKGPVTSNSENVGKESISANKMADLANELANLFSIDQPITLRRRKKPEPPKWAREGGDENSAGDGVRNEEPEDEEWDKVKFTTTTPTTTTTTKRTTLALADPHYYPYPYHSQLFPITTTTIWRTRKLKTTTTTTTLSTTTVLPHVDIPRMLPIVQDLTSDFESNHTEMLNETLQRYNIPTCPPIGWRGPVFHDLANAAVAKCSVCGLKETAMPKESICGDAFASDFLPLDHIDPQARSNLERFRNRGNFPVDKTRPLAWCMMLSLRDSDVSSYEYRYKRYSLWGQLGGLIASR